MRQGFIWLFAFLLISAGVRADIDPELTGEWGQFQDRCLKALEKLEYLEGREIAGDFVARALKVFGENNDITANAIHWQAVFAQMSDSMSDADKAWRRVLSIDETLHGVNSVESSRPLLMLGGNYCKMGDFRRGRDFLQRSLLIRQEKLGRDHPKTVTVLFDLGRTCLRLGRWDEAKRCFEETLTIYEKMTDPWRQPQVATTLLDLAGLYLEISDADSAERCLELQSHMKRNGAEEPASIRGRRSEIRGYIHILRHQYSEAEQCFKENIAIVREDCSPYDADKKFYWVAHLPLEMLYLRRGDLCAAESVARSVLVPLIETDGIDTPNKSWALRLLAEQKKDSGDYEGAEQTLKKAQALMDSSSLGSAREKRVLLAQIAELQFTGGNTNAALRLADEIQDLEENLLNWVLSFTSERQRLGFLFTEDRYSLWASFRAVRPLARAVLRTKGLVLDSLLEDRSLGEKLRRAGRGDLLEPVQQARQRMVEVNAALTAGAGRTNQQQRWSEEVASVLRGLDSAQSALARRLHESGRSRRALSITLEQVQRAIPQNAAVVELLSYQQKRVAQPPERSYGALVLFPQMEPRWVPLGSAASLDREVSFYLHALHAGVESESLEGILREISARLWNPIASALPAGTTNLIVSPDSQLNFVSFAALPQPNGRFVAEDFNVSYISTARDLLEDTARERPFRSLALWADPAFSQSVCEPAGTETMPPANPATLSQIRPLQFAPLEGARREGAWLQQNASEFGFQVCQAFTGLEATEAQLRQVSAPSVLHFATHGFFLPALESGSPDHRKTDVAARLLCNPMLRSGVALAGAQHTLEEWKRGKIPPADNDGIVTAEEIASLDLRDTLLVVLAACDTGGGEALAGEGVLGLRRGFIQAGAENLLMALWPVEDKGAPDFILEVYKALGAGSSPARALSQVQGQWLGRLRTEKGIAAACRATGPFVLSFRGRISSVAPAETNSFVSAAP